QRIPYLSLQPNASVTIFDRYGKLVGSFRGNNGGWDGNSNGNNLPSTDYWFVLELEDGRKIKGHFAMLR
ncbi:T9SS type B sorting domain-containing protein, partial [uncultured Flavobacterium sp.]|uniref:T9SS type B sorting domain-containing protein n=1 Tax=uncultured Flavobacterium sp. TaxID=165435 RepID=UPI0025EEAC26